MRELKLDISEAPSLKINGKEYQLKLSDVQIIALANALKHKYEGLAKKQPSEDEILEAVQNVAEAIDTILGEGAVAEISQGKPVSFRLAMKWLTAITEESMAAYSEWLENEYD